MDAVKQVLKKAFLGAVSGVFLLVCLWCVGEVLVRVFGTLTNLHPSIFICAAIVGAIIGVTDKDFPKT